MAIIFLTAFFLLGALVKFIDDAFDEKAYPRKFALILAPITAIFWAYIMALDPMFAVLLTAIILGVIIKGKIDNVAFVIAVLCVYLVYFFFGVWHELLTPFYLFLIVIIAIAGVLDEIGNDYVDNNQIFKKGFFGKIVHYFFEYRFTMKLFVLFLSLLGFFHIFFFVVFFFWDIGYEFVMNYTKLILAKRKFYYNGKSNGY